MHLHALEGAPALQELPWLVRMLQSDRAQNGPIEFWYITPTDEAIALKQWAPGEPVYRIVDGSSYEKVKVAVPEGKWMHNNVQEWGAEVF